MRFCIDREDMLLAAYQAVRRRHGIKPMPDDQIVTEVAMEAQKGMWEMRDYWIVEPSPLRTLDGAHAGAMVRLCV